MTRSSLRQPPSRLLRAAPRSARQLRRNLTTRDRRIEHHRGVRGYAATVDDVEAPMPGEEPLETREKA
ncbi:hypothetical protein ABZ371_25730 [Streptomyces sp. NPDC005899]|uniref:hypothetical protein n=1 Tax=Streptomyces sp. NPDC005899 TaxID=3155716 RepID=UPI0033D90027